MSDCVIEMVNRHAEAVERREEAQRMAQEKACRQWRAQKKLFRLVEAEYGGVPATRNDSFLAAVGIVCVTALVMWVTWLCL